jgi:hypothetical protein
MSDYGDDLKLSSRAYVTLILRLLVAQGGQLVEGQVVDVSGALRGRFTDWPGLVPRVREALEHTEGEAP